MLINNRENRPKVWYGTCSEEVSVIARPSSAARGPSPRHRTSHPQRCLGALLMRHGQLAQALPFPTAGCLEAHWTGRAGHEAYGPLPLRCGVSLQMLVHVPGDEKLQFCKKLRPRLRDRQKNSAGTSFAQYLLEGLARELAQSPLHAVRR